MEKILQILTLRIDEFILGVDIFRVERIIAAQSIIELADKPNYVMGLLNFFGEILAVIDLRERLGIRHKRIEPSDKFVIVNTNSQKLVIIVDEVLTISNYSQANITLSSEIYDGMKFISVASESKDLVFIYDLSALIDVNETIAIDSIIHQYRLNVAV